MNEIIHADCLDWMRQQSDNSVDLVFTSPPYEDARTYGIDYTLRGDEWVQWTADRFCEAMRICKGLVAFVVEGRTKSYRWSAAPALLMTDLHRRGVKLRKPPIYQRVGVPGSGGPDWLRNDYEFVVCASNGKLPWSDNTAMGEPPKYGKGGEPSHRLQNGERVEGSYRPPVVANPGNIIRCKVGRGHMGSDLAHETEAPFPESLAEFFVRSFCPPEGIVLDPFCGSGTTLAVASKCGRQYIGVDIRESQVELSTRRTREAAQPLFR